MAIGRHVMRGSSSQPADRASPAKRGNLYVHNALGLADTDGNVYHGRTLELDVEDVYAVTYVPVGTPHLNAAGSRPPKYDAKYAFIAIGAPDRAPTADDPLGPSDVKVIEGMNTAGVSFSLLAYRRRPAPRRPRPPQRRWSTPSTWARGPSRTSPTSMRVKQGIADHGISLTLLPFVGNLPFHSTSSPGTRPARRS